MPASWGESSVLLWGWLAFAFTLGAVFGALAISCVTDAAMAEIDTIMKRAPR